MDYTTILPEKAIYTYEDYAKLPEMAPYQLIGGKLIYTPSRTPYHQEVSQNLMLKIRQFAVIDNKLGKVLPGPIDLYFEETETFIPDIIFISRERNHIIGEEKTEGAPDIVFEVLSPSTAYYDLRPKKDVYAKHGVKEYWIVDPMEKSVEVHEEENGDYLLKSKVTNSGSITSDVLQGLTIDLENIF